MFVVRLLSLAILSLLFSGLTPVFASTATPCPAIEVNDAQSRQALLSQLCFLTATPSDSFYTASSPDQLPDHAEWQTGYGHPLVFKNNRNVYWVRLKLRNGSDLRDLWYVKLHYPQLDEVTFWNTASITNRPLETGDRLPYFSRIVDYRYFLLPVRLNAGETATVTLRVHTEGAINIPLTLETPDEALGSSNHLTLAQGVFFGGLLIFSIFNALVFVGTRMISHLYKAFYLASLGMFMFAMSGLASRYFWPDSPEFANKVIPGVMAFCLMSMTLFAKSFLEIRPGSHLNRLLVAMVAVSALLVVQVPFTSYGFSLKASSSLGPLFMAVLTTVGIVRWIQGYSPAKWYVLACGSLFLGALIYALAVFKLLPEFMPTEIFSHPMVGQLSIGAQVLLMNYALVKQWQLINQRLLDAESNARFELKEEVNRRTRELKEANRRLMSLSLDDPLTGLRNRRHLDNLLPELFREAKRNSTPLSVAILDADHFKSLNDRWGHEFGDQCLKFIADVLREHTKRPRDSAVRYGGEEFALLLPDTSTEGALELCNRILRATELEPIETPDGNQVTITLSAGVATLTQNETTAVLLRRADEALYNAKAAGRNQASVSL